MRVKIVISTMIYRSFYDYEAFYGNILRVQVYIKSGEPNCS